MGMDNKYKKHYDANRPSNDVWQDTCQDVFAVLIVAFVVVIGYCLKEALQGRLV